MPKGSDETVEFGRVGRRVVEAAFDGGDIVSDGGVLLLKQVATTTATCRCTSSPGRTCWAWVLRPSDRDPASVVSTLIKRLLVPLRRAWPKTKTSRGRTRGFATHAFCGAWSAGA
jgi:hypothetical protein